MVKFFGEPGDFVGRLRRTLIRVLDGSESPQDALARTLRPVVRKAAAARINLAPHAPAAEFGSPIPFAKLVQPDQGVQPGAVLLRDVLVGDTSNDSVLARDGTTLMSNIENEYFSPSYCNIPRRFIAQLGLTLIRKIKPADFIERGVYLGSFALENWFHFVTRVAAGATLLSRLPEQFRDWPLLLPEANFPAASEQLLDAVLDGRPVVRFPPLEYLQVARMLWIDPATRGLNHLRPNGEEPIRFALHRPTFVELRSRVLTMIDDRRPSARRVLLDRGVDDSRPYNRTEVMELLGGLGFEAVRMDLLPLEEQIGVMAHADVVVGPTGAAWTNMLWMRPGARALYWIPRHLSAFSVWKALAEFTGVRLIQHPFDVANRRFFGVPYQVDVPRLESDVRRLVT